MMDRIKIAAALLVALLLLTPAGAQAAPTLSAVWQGRSLVVTWSGVPAGSCLYLDGVFVPVPCGASGRAVLPVGGVDTAYAPRGGDQLALAVDTTEEPSVRATVPMVVVRLPVIARE